MLLNDVPELGQVGLDQFIALLLTEQVVHYGLEKGPDHLEQLDVVALLGLAD